MGKKEEKQPTIDNGNGHSSKQELVIPDIMQGGQQAVSVVEQFRSDMQKSNRGVDLSKYYVMEGMQNKDKLNFFTEFENSDDVLRMNTIEMYVTVSPMIIRKTSVANMARIKTLLKDVYTGHVETHKTNMVSNNRKREDAYVRILSSDSSDSGVVPTGFKKFFGVGGGGGSKKN